MFLLKQRKHILILNVLMMSLIVWFLYNLIFRKKSDHNDFMKRCVIPVKPLEKLHPSYSSNRGVEYETCYNGWSIGHFLTYFMCGLVIPHQYAIIFAYSVLCEGVEFLSGYTCRLSDLYINMFAYLLGSQIKIQVFRKKIPNVIMQYREYSIYTLSAIVVMMFGLGVIKYFNKQWD